MKKFFIVHSNMEIGGAETSLLGLLKSIDYDKYKVDLLLLNPVGELMNMIPKQVRILSEYSEYRNLLLPIKEVIKNKNIKIFVGRLKGKLKANKENKKLNNTGDLCYLIKEYSHKYAIKSLPNIKGNYDLGISFIDPHYILQQKVSAKVKLGWLHTDFTRINVNREEDLKMWDGCDYIVSVSDSCKNAFDNKYPELIDKSIVIENILPLEYVRKQSNAIDVSNEISKESNVINICSIGRFSEQKNFDNVPNIAKRIINQGYKIRWFIIGYGSEEELIRKRIQAEEVTDNVIILGKKDNPYPYLKSCDIYVQPSRYEGKAVTVREAQMLNKPVVITKFATADSQLKDLVDGVIVPMDNDGCAKGIVAVIDDINLRSKLINGTKENDYSNKSEVEKIYKLI
ncbi:MULTISPECIES: glycosyltransferase [Clostridium]|uniref:glycosyltransferase n=1 Tax=Clostridium TaxID=1485 RepID=UPI000820CFD7|nr:glycosyltransferase [Clostridium saudiense]MDU7454054.1 glycosyltransferase [Clostridium saudiense]SCJ90951.1 colanic acid biosynthesis glycosyltransferase WcaL [uncultured Clostridium sp.]